VTPPAALLPDEVRKAVTLLDLRARRLVSGQFGGAYRAMFKGHGIEFAELREYQPGDDVRGIDWKVTARMRRPFVRRYVEERELAIMLLLDVSGSSWFGTRRQLKAEVATELAAALVLSAARQNDRVGVIAFTDRIELMHPPRKGRRHAMAVVRDLLVLEPKGTGTDLTGAMRSALALLPQRGVLFAVSDFADASAEPAIRRAALRHDCIACVVEDPAERDLPQVGVARLVDPESGETIEVDTSDPVVRGVYARAARAADAARDRMLRASGADVVTIGTDVGFLEPMLRYLRARQGRGAK
jgi:uncharacterized protein (DUF58 family)